MDIRTFPPLIFIATAQSLELLDLLEKIVDAGLLGPQPTMFAVTQPPILIYMLELELSLAFNLPSLLSYLERS